MSQAEMQEVNPNKVVLFAADAAGTSSTLALRSGPNHGVRAKECRWPILGRN